VSLSAIHRGQKLTQQQLDALVPVLNDRMHGKISEQKFEAAVDEALEKAGCPVADVALETKR